MTNIFVLSGAALLSVSTPAWAQSSEQPRGQMIEELTVTAQRREQNLQTVPIAVQAFSGERLAQLGATQTSDLQTIVPGLTFTRLYSVGFPFIRGIGQNTASLGFESPNALYVDGVYIPGGNGNLFSFNNIERIEVLKGPQGTLFGRNAAGGVVQVISRAPSQHPMVDAMVGYGNYQTYEGSLYATGPITDRLSVDLAAIFKDQREGWGHSLTTGKKVGYGYNYGLRGSFLWRADDGEVRGFITRVKAKDDFGASAEVYPGTLARNGISRYTGRYHPYTMPERPFNLATATIAGLTASRQFGRVKVTNILGYSRLGFGLFANQQGFEATNTVPAFIVDSDQKEKTFTEEFQLSNADKTSRLQWIGGLYYLSNDFNRTNRHDNLRPATGYVATPYADAFQYMASYALFAQATYAITPETRVTGGLRYTEDRKKYSSRATLTAPFTVKKASWGKLTWRAAIDHNLNDNVMVYASYNRGFKSGAYNVTVPSIPPNENPVRPEVVDTIEAGFKSDLLDHKVRLNVSAFHTNYSNLQVRVITLNGATILTNAATAKINGGEVEVQVNPFTGLLLTGTASVLDAKYKRFPNGPISVPLATGGAQGGLSADLSGNRLGRTPKVTYSFGALYTIPTEFGDVNINAKLFHSGKYFWEPDNFLTQPAYTTLDASVGWKPKDGRLGIEIWAKNLTDETYFVAGTTAGSYVVNLGAPRTFGVRMRVKYN